MNTNPAVRDQKILIMLDEQELHEVVKLSTKYAFEMAKELLGKNPTYTSRKEATKKYKGLLSAWEEAGLVKAIPTESAKHDVFPTHRLVELYEIWTMGRTIKKP